MHVNYAHENKMNVTAFPEKTYAKYQRMRDEARAYQSNPNRSKAVAEKLSAYKQRKSLAANEQKIPLCPWNYYDLPQALLDTVDIEYDEEEDIRTGMYCICATCSGKTYNHPYHTFLVNFCGQHELMDPLEVRAFLGAITYYEELCLAKRILRAYHDREKGIMPHVVYELTQFGFCHRQRKIWRDRRPSVLCDTVTENCTCEACLALEEHKKQLANATGALTEQATQPPALHM
jgi:hypothetical protein